MPKYLNPRQAGEHLGLPESTVRHWIDVYNVPHTSRLRGGEFRLFLSEAGVGRLESIARLRAIGMSEAGIKKVMAGVFRLVVIPRAEIGEPLLLAAQSRTLREGAHSREFLESLECLFSDSSSTGEGGSRAKEKRLPSPGDCSS